MVFTTATTASERSKTIFPNWEQHMRYPLMDSLVMGLGEFLQNTRIVTAKHMQPCHERNMDEPHWWGYMRPISYTHKAHL